MKYPLAAFIILDGWGERSETDGNAVKAAKTPNIDKIVGIYPPVYLKASGEEVGLPRGQMGNSEVGHLNFGAGRIVEQDILRIDKAVSDGSFYENSALNDVASFAKRNKGAIHILGLLSDGGVHSSLNHLFALIEWAKKKKFSQVFIHAFLDGRDTPPKSALEYVEITEKVLEEKGIGKIATICGRYYAMDRDKRWERLWEAYKTLVFGRGLLAATAKEAVIKGYERGETDEFLLPTIIASAAIIVPSTVGATATLLAHARESCIKDGDGVIFYNFRADRARQLTRALIQENFDGFSRSNPDLKNREGNLPPNIAIATMTEYDASLQVPVMFPPSYLINTFGEWISRKGYCQLRLAETEKYAHVTYFFSGGREEPFPNEDRILIPSPKTATYDLQPGMSAIEVTQEAEKRILSGKYQFIIMNYANLDMVGHTGNFNATVAAVETVDDCVGKVLAAILEIGGVVVLTSDHGKAEQMIDHDNNQPQTAHTTNPVPCYFIGKGLECLKFKSHGILADVTPTLLEIVGVELPSEMTGKSLLEKQVLSCKNRK